MTQNSNRSISVCLLQDNKSPVSHFQTSDLQLLLFICVNHFLWHVFTVMRLYVPTNIALASLVQIIYLVGLHLSTQCVLVVRVINLSARKSLKTTQDEGVNRPGQMVLSFWEFDICSVNIQDSSIWSTQMLYLHIYVFRLAHYSLLVSSFFFCFFSEIEWN